MEKDSAFDETNLQVAGVIGRRKYEGCTPFLIVFQGRPARHVTVTQNFRTRIIAHTERQVADIPFNGQDQDHGSISNKMKERSSALV
jgi:hypothetical protein